MADTEEGLNLPIGVKWSYDVEALNAYLQTLDKGAAS